MKLLIADDDCTMRTLLQAVLKKWGYEFVSATDGHEVWDALQKTDAPQLAILDWMMPGMTGPEVYRKLRAQDRPEPLYLILLTSKDERQNIIEGLSDRCSQEKECGAGDG